jgi:hypothetical protein
LQRLLQVGHALGGPFDQTHRVAFGIEQGLKIAEEGLVLGFFLFPACSLLSLPPSWHIAISPFKLLESTANRILGDACLLGYVQKTSPFLRF